MRFGYPAFLAFKVKQSGVTFDQTRVLCHATFIATCNTFHHNQRPFLCRGCGACCVIDSAVWLRLGGVERVLAR